MKILSIETSCDETAVSVIEADGELARPSFKTLSNLVLSQVKIHEKYGGVFPNLAKREHAKNLVPLLEKALEEAGLLRRRSVGQPAKDRTSPVSAVTAEKIKKELSHEPELYPALINFLESVETPPIDLIAVTAGPGLEPALWVGVNASKILSEIWNIPVMPVNHLEGHIFSVLSGLESTIEFPALALLISGGHTELVLVSDWLEHQVIGETRDDAVGEAYDKVARMLDLPYPGGPQIGALAEEARLTQKTRASQENRFKFPRPMLKSGDLDFSFSGLKTSVLYAIRKISALDEETKKEIALAFEDAVVETLVTKVRKAVTERAPKSVIVAGGVIANKTLRKAFENLAAEFPGMKLLTPSRELSTDNALMIALAAYVRRRKEPSAQYPTATLKAQGNLRLS